MISLTIRRRILFSFVAVLAVMSAMAVLSYFRFIRTGQEALAADLPVGFPQQRAVADPE